MKTGSILRCIASVVLGGRFWWAVSWFSGRFQTRLNRQGRIAFPFVKRRRKRNCQILTYHRINDESDSFFPGIPVKIFEQQMRVLADHFTVCTLDDLIERIKYDDLPESAVAVTFDDGYRDNYTNAFPILRRYSLPATVFLATDAIGTGRQLWHDEVFSTFRTTKVNSLRDFPTPGIVRPLRNMSEKLAAQKQVIEFLWSLREEERVVATSKLVERLDVCTEKAQNLMLSWDEVIFMHKHGISFGSHTVTHPILSKVSDDRLKAEIVESKCVIEEKLHAKVEAFAYPVGRSQDFDNRTKQLLKDVGYRCAVTTVFGVNRSGSDLFELRRGTPWERDILSFAIKLAWYRMAHGE